MTGFIKRESAAKRCIKWLWRLVSHNFGYKLLAVGLSVLIWITIGIL